MLGASGKNGSKEEQQCSLGSSHPVRSEGQLAALSRITTLAQAVVTLIEWNGAPLETFCQNGAPLETFCRKCPRKVFNIKLLSIFELKKCPKIMESP